MWRLLRQYPNLYVDISANSGLNALTRDPEVGIRFLDEFQDKLLFATDNCFADSSRRMPHLRYLKQLLNEGKISHQIYDKMTYINGQKLLTR